MKIDKSKEHWCIDCADFIPDKKIKIGLCAVHNKIVHKDEKICRIKRPKKGGDR